MKDKNAEAYEPDLKVTRSIADLLGGKRSSAGRGATCEMTD